MSNMSIYDHGPGKGKPVVELTEADWGRALLSIGKRYSRGIITSGELANLMNACIEAMCSEAKTPNCGCGGDVEELVTWAWERQRQRKAKEEAVVRQRHEDAAQKSTRAERQLQRTALKFEAKYFEDLTLKSAAVRRGLCGYLDNGRWHCIESHPPNITIDGWIFRLRRLQKCDGRCESYQRTILVQRGLPKKDHEGVLLHEMIHAYEHQLPQEFREWLLVDLHQRVSKRIGVARMRRWMDKQVRSTEPGHGIIFLLKSLDLDLCLRWRLGTVFGYGRDDWFGTRKKEVQRREAERKP